MRLPRFRPWKRRCPRSALRSSCTLDTWWSPSCSLLLGAMTSMYGRTSDGGSYKCDGLRAGASAGVGREPVQGGLAGIEDRDVAIVRASPPLGGRASAREPLAMRARYHPVQ